MQWVIIALGGALGALCRSCIYKLFPITFKQLLFIPTLIVNIIGSFMIGIAFYLLVEKNILPVHWKIFIFPGFLAAFTTFFYLYTRYVSTVSVWFYYNSTSLLYYKRAILHFFNVGRLYINCQNDELGHL